MSHYPLFWMRSNNLGDALNPALYEAITGRQPEWSEDSPKLLAVGSTLHEAGPGDVVWGTGCISADIPLKASPATKVCMVRGPLTAARLRERGVDVPGLYGEPGLLLSTLFPQKKVERSGIGFVRHYTDASIDVPLPDGVKVIDIMNPEPLETVRQIASCQMVVSSALHGIIVAEAYGVPAVWVELSDNVTGEGFKFWDYYEGTWRDPVEPLDWREGADWEQAKALADKWIPPAFDTGTMLEACPFDWHISDYVRWASPGNWPDRLKVIANMIPSDSHVLDCGAGNMALRAMLPEGCKYFPLDLVRRSARTKVYDLNSGTFMELQPHEVIVFSGSLEYVYNVPRLLSCLPPCRMVLASYAVTETNSNREANGWVNGYTTEEFKAVFAEAGFVCQEEVGWQSQKVFRFVRA